MIAGQRMDLNRPFGDGRDSGDGKDNNGDGTIDEPNEPGDPYLNGIVDEPEEAGEPYLDVNNNGKWDQASRGSMRWQSASTTDRTRTRRAGIDQLWAELTERDGLIHEKSASITPTAWASQFIPDGRDGGIPATAVVRNLASEARQLYARQLYCLMLLLVGRGYAATPNVP